VVQRGSGARLPLKTGKRAWGAGDFIGQELQSHEPVKANVFGLVDHARFVGAYLLDDAVMGNGLASEAVFALLERHRARGLFHGRILEEPSRPLL
jgi:hypothetical protein